MESMGYDAWLIAIVHGIVAPTTALHALLHKRDPSAALGWIAVCLFFPLAGPFLYVLFGINRVRNAAKELSRRSPVTLGAATQRAVGEARTMLDSPGVAPELSALARASTLLSYQPLVYGNSVEPLYCGEQAYPAMLQAIDEARKRVYLTTYIFEHNRTGLDFMDALARATQRGLDVRVIVDGVGEFYSYPRASTLLRRRGVRVKRFLPPRLLPPSIYINLRNHRKILVADGEVAFTGGMNIGDRHLAEDTANPRRVTDMHFRLTGPVVAQMEAAFLDDWAFVTGETTPRNPVHAPPETGSAICRTILDGPVQDADKLATLLVSAVCAAHRRVLMVSPYFLPAPDLVGALQAAALRGIRVDIVLPARNNLPFVHWATRNMLPELVTLGVNVYYQPPPFAHTKLFTVDEQYMLIGSANIDPRSLRLNFELAVEIYDGPTVRRTLARMDRVIARSQPVTAETLRDRSLAARVRDALAWLFSPYL